MALFLLQRYLKQKDKSDEVRESALARENILILKSINAMGKLTYANAIAIRDGKHNGQMHDAMKEYEEINTELYDYLLEQNAHK
jgi:hypothetical protein